MKKIIFLICFGCFIFVQSDLKGQATLNIQGFVRKSSGADFDDGTYTMRFRLFTAATGSNHIWEENHNNSVDITSGVYNVVLGLIKPLTIPFNIPYYLGVSVDGGADVSPRLRLTAAPYSLSLMGQSNIFPSKGSVGLGTITPDTSSRMHLKNDSGTARMLLEGKDTAVIVLKTLADTASISFNGSKISIPDLNINYSSGVTLPRGQSVIYNNLPTWQLLEVDTILDNSKGWACYNDWKTTTISTFERFDAQTPFNSFIIRPSANGNDIIAKEFDLRGIPHTMVKVVFTYHFFDTWDDDEFGFAAFGTKQNPYDGDGQISGILQVGWKNYAEKNFDNLFSKAGYFVGDVNLKSSDYNTMGEMVAQTNADKFWVIFGSNLGSPASDESYGISNVQIWVR